MFSQQQFPHRTLFHTPLAWNLPSGRLRETNGGSSALLRSSKAAAWNHDSTWNGELTGPRFSGKKLRRDASWCARSWKCSLATGIKWKITEQRTEHIKWIAVRRDIVSPCIWFLSKIVTDCHFSSIEQRFDFQLKIFFRFREIKVCLYKVRAK